MAARWEQARLFSSCYDAGCLMLSVRIPRICLGCQPQRKQRPETPDLLPPAGPDLKIPSTADWSTFRTAANRHRVPGRIRTKLTFRRKEHSTLPSPARTPVHHLVFRDRGWYRRFLRFERGRGPNSMNSNSFPVLRNRVSFAIRCKMPSEGRSFIDRRTRRVEASDAKTRFCTDAGVLNSLFIRPIPFKK